MRSYFEVFLSLFWRIWSCDEMSLSEKGVEEREKQSEEDDESEEKIRVGEQFQAVVPEYNPPPPGNRADIPDRALLVWKPTTDIDEAELDQYLLLASEKYGYNCEQALGLLFWHKYDLSKAISDLSNFTPLSEEWSLEEKLLFEQGFMFSGKDFRRIQMTQLPNRPIESIVRYYYKWKKMKSHVSLMDQQVKKVQTHHTNNIQPPTTTTATAADLCSSSEADTNADTELEEKKWVVHRGIKRETGPCQRASKVQARDNGEADERENSQKSSQKCSNCNISCTFFHPTAKGFMCRTCAGYFDKKGTARPLGNADKGRVRSQKERNSLPRGMYINHDDLKDVVSQSEEMWSESNIRRIENELAALKCAVQRNKQRISTLKEEAEESMDAYRVTIQLPKQEPNGVEQESNSLWTNDEILLVIEGMRKFGRDFQCIAEIIGTKTEAQIKTFYDTYQKKFNLDSILQEWEATANSIADSAQSNNDTALCSNTVDDDDDYDDNDNDEDDADSEEQLCTESEVMDLDDSSNNDSLIIASSNETEPILPDLQLNGSNSQTQAVEAK